MQKTCNTCKVSKNLSEFTKNNSTKDRLSNKCKSCIKEHYLKNKDKNLKLGKKYYEKHKENINKKHEKYRNDNRDLCNSLSRTWKRNNREKCETVNKEWNEKNQHRLKGYGLRKYWPELSSLERVMKYYDMLRDQDQLCAICGKPETAINHQTNDINPLSVDHDHKTGKIRMLLCGKCNRILGFCEEDIDILQRAIEYIIRFRDNKE